MKIQDIMTRPVESCRDRTDLAAAAMIMWRQDCGVVPVVDMEEKVVGVITDRDICIAVATRHRRPEELAVGDVMANRLFTIRPDDDVRAALDTMRHERIRRLPVVDANQRLVGVLSLNDIVRAAKPVTARGTGELNANDVLETLKTICVHPLPMLIPEPELEAVHAG
jgi:CBS domain-containing protein